MFVLLLDECAQILLNDIGQMIGAFPDYPHPFIPRNSRRREMSLPLQDISVLDFSGLLPGPFASAMLAAAGARVTKIEKPQGDDIATIPPLIDGVSALYRALNHQKDIVKLDLRTASGCEDALRRAAEVDIVLTQFRPGVMDRLGLGYGDVRAVNPRVIYCAISGYGQAGPQAQRAGHDLNYLADSGVLTARAGEPAFPAGLIADVGGGSFPAVINILLALRHRDASGEGAFLDICMTDNVKAFIPYATIEARLSGRFDPGRCLFGGTSPRYRLYRTADNGVVAVGTVEDKFWHTFCGAIGVDGSQGGPTDDELASAIKSIIAAKSTAEWQSVFQDIDCCVSILSSSGTNIGDTDLDSCTNGIRLPIDKRFSME
jgi:alpha-methylacyl-CoA racemase